jgi:NADPH:quinone reductase-like Zn-dependent oxidoreductase
MFERFVAALEATAIRPVIDRVFPFDQAALAYEHLASQEHLGKVVIEV